MLLRSDYITKENLLYAKTSNEALDPKLISNWWPNLALNVSENLFTYPNR